MKKTLFLLLAVLGASAAFGQKPKVAIYTDDKSEKNYAAFAGEFLTNAIVKRGVYGAYERTTDFLSLLSKEHGYQRSGAVTEKQIARLGEQLGVQLVCAVKIDMMDGQPFISAKLIDVETSGITGTARPTRFSIGDFDGFEKACETITASMFGERGRSLSASGNRRVATGGGQHRNGDAYNYEGIDMIFVEGTGGALGTPSFYIGKYEVTQAQWQAVMGSNPSGYKGANKPVENVSWDDVQEFLQKLNAKVGGNFRLPTETEWEYAASGGLNKDNYEYAGSNTIGLVAWFKDNSGGATHPVGTKQPNSIGIYDMSGNVWEWCQDCYDSSCATRVERGGSEFNSEGRCRVASRASASPGARYDNLGFRLACSSN